MSDARQTVLVVDDDPAQRGLLERVLGLFDLNVQLAASGQEALDQLARSLPDLVLLDMQMPDMNGFETLSEIKRIYGDQSPPVVGLSGAPFGDPDQAAVFDDYILKPFSISQLGDRLKPYVNINSD
ncbi:MAG: response regulator [Planctomycetales bacterium]|nr:response regulator [Planctomycetales bacterium]